MAPKRPPQVVHNSLAECYAYFCDLFVAPSPIKSTCGCEVHCYEHHFVHMVKLIETEGEAQRIFFPDHKEKIIAATSGFGEYAIEATRARTLAASLDCLRDPDVVVRSPALGNADRVFIKEFDELAEYRYNVVLVGVDGDKKLLYSGYIVRKRSIKKYMVGDILYSKTPQPPD